MSVQHHDLDVHPIPEDKNPLYINEPWLIDRSQAVMDSVSKEPQLAEDNIRVYIPLYRLEARLKREMATALDRLRVSSEVRLYSIDDFVEMSGWSRKTVMTMFNDPAFPSMDYGKAKLVEAHALIAFLSIKHEKEREPYWIKLERLRNKRKEGK